MSKKKVFIANDETKKNSYGFRVLTAGINLTDRFADNPVCLNNHLNTTKDVLGKWIDIKVENGTLLMSPEFNTQDSDGLEVVRKVNEDIIRGCSIGILFKPEDMVNENGELVLKKCVLFEVSIVAIPANSAAISLYHENGEEMTENEIKSLCLSLQTAKPFENENKMKLLLAHLQLDEGSTEEAILLAVKAVEQKLTDSENKYATLKTQFDALTTEKTAKLQADYDALKTLALKDGRIDAAAVPTIEELSLEKRIELLNKLPKRNKIKDEMTDEDEASAESKYGKLSWSELDKGNHLAKLKADFPDYYAERFELQYGRKPNN